MGRTALACFVVGTHNGLEPPRAEVTAHRDLWVLDVPDSCLISISKMFAWWRRAAELVGSSGSGIRHVAKVDDDSFIHIPNLEADLLSLHCHGNRLYYGALASTGYDPATFQKCGFAAGRHQSLGLYRRYLCAQRGAKPPFPFAVGALQVLSPTLVWHIATDTSVTAFVNRSEHELDLHESHDEDVVLGYWLSLLHWSSPMQRLTYARLPPKPHRLMRVDLGCQRLDEYHLSPEENGTIVLHGMKYKQSMMFTWNVTRQKRPFNAVLCSRESGAA